MGKCHGQKSHQNCSSEKCSSGGFIIILLHRSVKEIMSYMCSMLKKTAGDANLKPFELHHLLSCFSAKSEKHVNKGDMTFRSFGKCYQGGSIMRIFLHFVLEAALEVIERPQTGGDGSKQCDGALNDATNIEWYWRIVEVRIAKSIARKSWRNLEVITRGAYFKGSRIYLGQESRRTRGLENFCRWYD